MKPVRVLAFVLGGLAVLLLVAGAVVFNSSFQTWAARRALAQQPGLRGSIGSVSAGLSRVEVEQLRLETQGAVLTAPAIEVRLPLMSAALGS
ncbi:MAG TPA: hypothetical protein VG710_16200, partial [Opitutus sp.]|nr:hypothetical protein [Opitutus sp.]